MQDWFDTAVGTEWVNTPGGLDAVWLVLVLAFACGQIIGWIYMWTHAGLSYSRSFTIAMAALPMIVALVMLIMVDNIIVAFGLFAVFAIVRFRNIVKDTRDTSFVLWAILTGMALGTLRFSLAIIACAALAALFLVLRWTAFGARHSHDAILTLQWEGEGIRSLDPVLARHVVRSEVTSQRGTEHEGMLINYNLLMRDPARSSELVSELLGLTGVQEASLYRREEEQEL